MKKFKICLLLLILIIIPLNVEAGVMCNDGWESSCVVSGPGCCSHHGGVAGGGSYSGNNYPSGNNNSSALENGDYAGILTLIIIVGPIVIGYISFFVEKTKERKKIEEEQEKERIRIEQQNLKKIEERENYKKKIGTRYDDKETYIKKIQNQINKEEIKDYLINDGYHNIILPSEVLSCFDKKIQKQKLKVFINSFDRSYDLFYMFEDILNLDLLDVKLFNRIIKNTDIENKLSIIIKELVKFNKFNYINKLLEYDNFDININDFEKIANNDYILFNNIVDMNKCSYKELEHDIYHTRLKSILENQLMLEAYIKNGPNVAFNNSLVFADLVKVLDDMSTMKLIKKYKKSYENDRFIFKEIYIQKKKESLKYMYNNGFVYNIFSKKTEQEQLPQYINGKDEKYIDLTSEIETFKVEKNIRDLIKGKNNFDSFKKVMSDAKISVNSIYDGEPLIIYAIRYGNDLVVEYLLKNKCCLDILNNGKNTNGLTPLDYAVYKGNIKIISLMIENDANINYPDINGQTALDYACSKIRPNYNIVKLIAKHGGKTQNSNDMIKIKDMLENDNQFLIPYIYVRKARDLEKKNN